MSPWCNNALIGRTDILGGCISLLYPPPDDVHMNACYPIQFLASWWHVTSYLGNQGN